MLKIRNYIHFLSECLTFIGIDAIINAQLSKEHLLFRGSVLQGNVYNRLAQKTSKYNVASKLYPLEVFENDKEPICD